MIYLFVDRIRISFCRYNKTAGLSQPIVYEYFCSLDDIIVILTREKAKSLLSVRIIIGVAYNYPVARVGLRPHLV